MCQFGTEEDIIEELNLSEDKALIGWRNNYILNSFNDKEKFLISLSNGYTYPKDKAAEGLGLTSNNSLGIYNYNNYYYNNNYNYYNNYYNYYNYNYNYYNYNYNNYNNYYNNYNIQIKTLHYGKVFKYKEGYRSEYCKVTHIIILDKNSRWFSDNNTIIFANHFNNLCEQVAKEYHCETLEYSRC